MIMVRCPKDDCQELMPQGSKDCGKHTSPFKAKDWGVKHRMYSEEVIIEFISRISADKTPYQIQREEGMPTAQNVLHRCAKSPKLQALYDEAIVKCYPNKFNRSCGWLGCEDERDGTSKYCKKHKEKAAHGNHPGRKKESFVRLPGEPKPHHEKGPQRNRPMTVEEETRLDKAQHKLNLQIDRQSRKIPEHINQEMLAARVMRGAIVGIF